MSFSLSQLSNQKGKINKRLGSYTANSSTFIIRHLVLQPYHVWHQYDYYQQPSLLHRESGDSLELTGRDEIHQNNITHLRDPDWTFDTPRDILANDQFTTCLLAGLCKVALKAVNYEEPKRYYRAIIKTYLNS